MKKLLAAAGVILTVTTAVAVPTLASAQTRYYSSRDHRYHYTRARSTNCHGSRRRAGNTGTAAGAVVGGLSGAAMGGDALGTIVGAGAGAVLGHSLAKGSVRC